MFDRTMTGLSVALLRLVGATCKITLTGRADLLDGSETFAVGFWHGDSFCYYPILKNRGDVIITSSNKRGAVVEMIGKKFGYNPVRLPDESDPDISLLSLRRMLADAKDHHICFSMDGPLGPRHIPARFYLTAAVLTKKRVLPVSVVVKRKIQSKKRWDKYILPLPFARLTFTFHEPMEVKKSEFGALTEKIIEVMNGEPRR